MPCALASRSTTGAHSTRSALNGSLAYGNVSTLVAWSWPRYSRLRAKPSAMSTTRTVISAGTASAARIQRATSLRASTPRWRTSANWSERRSAGWAGRRRGEGADAAADAGSAALRVGRVIGLDDARDQRMADDVGRREARRRDALDVAQHALGLDEARDRALGQVDLAGVAGDD